MPFGLDQFQDWQWGLGALSALLIGFAKAGVPGTGILVVPIMAAVFGGRLSVGATLPMLIMADIVAVRLYWGDAEWGHIKRLAPWVGGGVLVGTVTLLWLGYAAVAKDPLNPIIGGIVLLMLALGLAKNRLNERLQPTGDIGRGFTGVMAGFTTMVANAAGPVMQIYLVLTGMPKQNMIGTTAWFFFLVNLFKLPFLFLVTWAIPSQPLITGPTLAFNLAMLPMILVGAFTGKRVQSLIPQDAFNRIVLVLSAVAAVRLLAT